jgi:transposase
MPKDSCKDSDKDRHTPIFEDNDTLQRVEIITGIGRRRRWTAAAKAAVVAESFATGASVSAVARRHDISPSLLFLWRRQVAHETVVADSADGSAPPAFVPVSITGCGTPSQSSEEPAIEIEVGTVRIRVKGTVDRRALRECWRRSGRRLSSSSLDCRSGLLRGQWTSIGDGLAGDASERGASSRSVQRRAVRVPIETRRPCEDPDLGWKRPCAVLQATRERPV